MEEITLRTGEKVVSVMIPTVRMALDSLLTNGISGFTALYDLREICRDPQYKQKVHAGNMKLLQDLSLVDPSGGVHDEIRKIVVASVTGEGLDIKIVSPLPVND